MNASNNRPSSLIAEFLAECEELLQKIQVNLPHATSSEFRPEAIDSIYRDIHTIKGSALLVSWSKIADLAHAMETCLEPVRKARVPIPPRFLECFQSCLDLIESCVTSPDAGTAGDARITETYQAQLMKLVDASLEISDAGPSPFIKETPRLLERSERPQSESSGDGSLTPSPQAASTPTSGSAAAPASTAASQPSAADSETMGTIRVPVTLLDRMMTLMGEMVLVRNQVLQYSNRSDDLEFLNLSQRLDLVTSELQGEVMKTRMQPIGNVLGKFQRVVRDLGRDLGKKIELTLEGTETELDKTLLETIKDPLTHIVRNSCDHGIESPEERRKAGKPEQGTLAIRSYHEGGQVIIEIHDDGKGLNRDKLIAKALEKGLISADRAKTLSEREAFHLIFLPGFSTAAQVTNVSGRGVGMDVVKSNVERIGGVVDLSSQTGQGTTLRLKIPLTLAIVPAMIVRSHDSQYAIPQVKLVELVRADRSESSKNKIEMLQGQPVYRLRGRILPLIDFRKILGVPPSEQDSGVVNIVVLNGERQMFGLIVDEIQDTADIVVKPLSRFLKSLSIYSGATVLGDGSVALILDVIGIAGYLSQSQDSSEESSRFANAAGAQTLRKDQDSQEFLLFKVNAQAKHAIPLTLVHRLEEFRRDAIECSGEQRVVRYRNSILPILSLNESLHYPTRPPEAMGDVISVIVAQKGGRSYGIEVEEILDVLSTELNFDDSLSDRPGIMGNLVTPEGVVVVVDALGVIDRAERKLGGASASSSTARASLNSGKKRILFAEDSSFFRKQVVHFLERAGFEVTAVPDGKSAWQELESGSARYDLVLSDIEMPHMNGFELASRIRSEKRFQGIPLVALTTRFTDADVTEGLRVGFDRYFEKLNQAEILEALCTMLSKKGNSDVAA